MENRPHRRQFPNGRQIWKDSPSNLFWIKDKYTEDIDGFRLTLDLVPDSGGEPKLVVTFQGEGGADGLSGWNLVLHPRGKGRVGARLERYDHLFYETPPVTLPKTTKKKGKKEEALESLPLVLTYVDGRLTVTIAEVDLLRDVPILPIPGRRRIGVSTWGPQLKFAGLELESLKEPR